MKDAIAGIGMGFILFIVYVIMFNGCYVEEMNVYLDDGKDDNRTIELCDPPEQAPK